MDKEIKELEAEMDKIDKLIQSLDGNDHEKLNNLREQYHRIKVVITKMKMRKTVLSPDYPSP